MMQLVALDKEHCETPELLQRVTKIVKSKNTSCYVTIRNGQEVAFLALDRLPQHLVIYELFVPSSLRRSGVGTAVLAEIERIAVEEGFLSIRVTPSPLDEHLTREELIQWYSQRGYVIDPANKREMIRQLGVREGASSTHVN